MPDTGKGTASKVIGSGLLEGDSGAAQQGPSAIGAPGAVTGGTGGGSPTYSRGVR